MRWNEKPSETEQKESFEAEMATRQSDEMSRAEKIRTRRQSRPKETPKIELGSSATRKVTDSRVPITRRSSIQQPAPAARRKHKTVQVPLRSKGAELQLLAMPRMDLGWRIISGAVFLFSLAVVISFSNLEAFAVNSINLVGAQRLSAEVLLAQLDLAGTKVIQLRPAEIEERIADRFPSLRKVSVSVRLPATVVVRVDEREPIISWVQDNTTQWIDNEGFMFPIHGEAETTVTVEANGDPPLLTDPEEMEIEEDTTPAFLQMEITHNRTTPEFVHGLLSLRDYIPEGSILQYDPRFGLGWEDPNGWLVYFGNDISTIDAKLSQYETILEMIRTEGISPTLISLDHLHAPFYRLEQ